MKLIIAFSDMNTMNQSEWASNYSQRKFTNLRELASLMTAFDGVCLNPVNGKSFCLRKEMVTAMLENRWGGIGDNRDTEIKQIENVWWHILNFSFQIDPDGLCKHSVKFILCNLQMFCYF